MAGLYRYCRSYVPTGVVCPNFMNRKDPCFCELSGVIQVRYRELREQDVGAIVKHAPVVTSEEEDTLWKSKIIDHNPLALHRAVFFYVGKAFCLRGGQEQRNLNPSQFLRTSHPDCYTYVENGSKNLPGINPHEGNKVVPVYACVQSIPRCLVYLLDTYFGKFPRRAQEMDVFYLRPRKEFKPESPWYECAPVGKEKLKTYMEIMCKEAGILGKKMNHSLRATGASALFNAGVPEKLIRDVTGHHSNALQLYERPTLQEKQKVSRVLMQGTQSLVKENRPIAPSQVSPSGKVLLSIFSGLSHCNIIIRPQNFTVNIGTSSTSISQPQPDIDVDNLLDGIELEQLLQ